MRSTSPGVYLVARPNIDWDEVERYLLSVGGSDWSERVMGERGPDAERLVEFAGRLCYRSWTEGINPNVKRVRRDSGAYLRNILSSAHGSVLEHANFTFIFQDVSRVFTHELVRHRAGTAISQESLRYVRLNDIPFRHPAYVKDDARLKEAADELLYKMEEFQRLTAEVMGLDDESSTFRTKKEITSAARRYAPIGLSTSMVWTANLRTLRHVIALRTAPAAEEEIRTVFDRVARIMKDEVPGLFEDFRVLDDGSWVPEYPKV